MKSLLLETQKLRAYGSDGAVLSPELDLSISSGDVVLLGGDNGSGKSTLLKTILGLHKKYSGKIQFHLPRQEVQYLPQLGNLHFHMPLTLLDVLDGSESGLLQGLDLNKKWNTASGGERQKVLLALVLSKKPHLLILDEPFNHVDKAAAEALEKALIQFLKDNPQSALLLVSHRPLTHMNVSTRHVELS